MNTLIFKHYPKTLAILIFISLATLTLNTWSEDRNETGDLVVVVYNKNLPDSKEVADHYAQARRVPSEQVLGFSLPLTENITRSDFRKQLEQPLWEIFNDKGFWTLTSHTNANEKQPAPRKVTQSKVRYLVLCYGVPTRIIKDTSIVEPGETNAPSQFQRNEAAVDSELCLLPMHDQHLPIFGPITNPLFLANNSTLLSPTSGLLMTARLDGPSLAIASGLVDKALMAETTGLWGRAYLDSRGLTNGDYLVGDEWIRNSAKICRKLGFDTTWDDFPATFPASMPMDHIAFYAGWYDWNVSGPFSKGMAQFMPGAFAYHLHSFSAQTIRSTNQNWVGPLLALGATATVGYVDEPFLLGTMDVAAFTERFLRGYSFGEAVYSSLGAISWQATVIGDPLYRPMKKLPADLHNELIQTKSPLLEWSILRAANINMSMGGSPSDTIAFLSTAKEVPFSAVLEEKLGELNKWDGRPGETVKAYERALKICTDRLQRMRLMLALAETQTQLRRFSDAIKTYRDFLKEFPDYVGADEINRNIITLAKDAATEQ